MHCSALLLIYLIAHQPINMQGIYDAVHVHADAQPHKAAPRSLCTL